MTVRLFPRHLYKFRAIPTDPDGRHKLEALLLDNTLWIADPESFNDPFDGKCGYELTLRGAALRAAIEQMMLRQGMTNADIRRNQRIIDDAVNNPRDLEMKLAQNMDTIRKQLGVCSLSATPRNPLLWTHYARDHKGICVQFRLAADIDALPAIRVIYQDEYPVLRDLDRDDILHRAMLPFLRKSTDWEYEKEWRIVTPDGSSTLRTFTPGALSGVVFGMRMSDDDRAYIRSLMDQREARYGHRPTLYEAKPAVRAYSVFIRKAP
jgi:hypothetical protein